MTTWKAQREELASVGLCAEALEMARRMTSAERHADRVQRTVAAARRAISDAPSGPMQSHALPSALIALDLGGIGGRGGYEGAATARMAWARNLGSGRWQARDGGAYRAAAESALQELQQALVVVSSETRVFDANGDVSVELLRELDDAHLGTEDAPWLIAAAQRAADKFVRQILSYGASSAESRQLVTRANHWLEFAAHVRAEHRVSEVAS